MKYSAFLLLLLASFTFASGQEKLKQIQYSQIENPTQELSEIKNLLGINMISFELSPEFKDYYCNIIYEEYVNGSLKATNNVRQKLNKEVHWVFKVGDNLVDNKFLLKFNSYDQDSVMKLNARIGELSLNKKLAKKKDLPYAWKVIYDLKNNTNKLIPGEKYPLIAYTSPVGKSHSTIPGASEFCLINGTLIAPSEWYAKLEIAHYYLFYINLEK